uniref:Class I histocompatibility antigen, F10 alpha chain-like n=1 Tax=Sinocyclocheilus rhinocerous TaxID=307959 RepID=A0A673KDQ9_9TELE
MNLIIFFIYMPFPHLVYSELHTFITTYTGISGKAIAGTPEFSAVTTLDGQQMDYYDSEIKKLIPKQVWMKEFASDGMWKKDSAIREHVAQIYKTNIAVLMQRFNQTRGVHTYQRMYGCGWDDETDIKYGFDQYGYDGEDFLTLDMKNSSYTASVPQAQTTVQKWNNREQLALLLLYFKHECIYWMKEFLNLSKAAFEKTEPPEVSLLQRNPDYYVECHVTGFHSRNTTITWRENGQAINDSRKLVKPGKILPNGDGTFQKNVTLYVLPDEWRMDQYACVVEHKSFTETIQKILTEDEIRIIKKCTAGSPSSPPPPPHSLYIIYIILFLVICLVSFALIVRWKCWSRFKARKY